MKDSAAVFIAIVVLAWSLSSGSDKHVTVYPVTCSGVALQATNRCAGGQVKNISSRVLVRADFASQTVRFISVESELIYRLTGDCEIFDRDSWFCVAGATMTRMEDGHLTQAGEKPEVVDGTIYLSAWRWWGFKVIDWLNA